MKKKKYLKPHSRIFSVNAQVLSGGSNTQPGDNTTVDIGEDIYEGDAGARGGLFFDTDDSEW